MNVVKLFLKYIFKIKICSLYIMDCIVIENESICEIYGVTGKRETLLKSMMVPYKPFQRNNQFMQDLGDFVLKGSYTYDAIVCYKRSAAGSYMRFIISKLVDGRQEIIKNMMGTKVAGED